MLKSGLWMMSRSPVEALLKDLEEECDMSVDKLRQVADAMAEEMRRGLAADGGSKLKMLITYVDKLPKGDETGTFYALDLGGTNLRVLRVELQGEGRDATVQDIHRVAIPPHIMNGENASSNGLFNFIASALAELVSREGEIARHFASRQRELGSTFSFPVRQNSISSGDLIKWTKDFDIEDAVGRDVVAELTKAIERNGLHMRVTALVNDTTGAFAAARYKDNDVVAAIILGTGSNAAYIERIQEIPKWHGTPPNSGEMVINMEWGNFCSSHLPLTKYDEEVDMKSFNPGEQILEKLISGMYLGEIVRRVLLRMAEEAALFGKVVPPKLRVKNIIGGPIMSDMNSDMSLDLEVVAAKLKEILEIHETSLETRRVVVRVCDAIAKRGARLAAAGIVGILKKLGRDTGNAQGKMHRSVIAVDGALYTKNQFYQECLHRTLKDMLGDNSDSVVVKPANDGSGIGAALLAATYSQYHCKS